MTRVACAQLDVVFNDPAANAQRAIQALTECRDNNVDIVVFPECFLTGYCVSSREEAENIAIDATSNTGHDVSSIDKSVTQVGDACHSLGLMAIVGFAMKDGTKLYNSSVLCGPNGLLKLYSKTHLPELGFDKFADPGTSLPVFETPHGRIGMLVCFDLRHPEPSRCLMLGGADLIALPTNWPEGAFAGPDFIAAARAAENRVFMATCNRVGHENGFDFIGKSGIYDVSGTTLAKAGAQEEIIWADVDLSQARNKRNVVRPGEFETTILESRHPELYKPITEPRNTGSI